MKHSYEIKTVYVGHRVYKIVNGFSIRVNITVKEINRIWLEKKQKSYCLLLRGKKIIVKDKRLSDKEYNWSEANDFSFNIKQFDYRIKPEPKYRPFKNAEECWAEMQKHQPFGWTKLIGAIEYSFITDVDDNTNYSGAIKEYTFADGTPFGIKEEE